MAIVWPTPDAAIREVTGRSPLVPRGIDYEAVPAHDGGERFFNLLDAHSRVLGILGLRSELEVQLLKGWAHGLSYQRMAKALGLHRTTVMRHHRRAWDDVANRLRAQGLVR